MSGATRPAVPDPHVHAAACSPEHGCSLCGDVAIPARIISIDAVAGFARAVAQDRTLEVALDLVDGVAVGDTILVHQGFAISRLDA